mmetsp:Transcript_9082/g.11818  ORF Transcript_9082/g.11818 Transcript_9082/m.11818 type:complete len:269 (-) Transcript_9082:303-1109(-)
MSRTSGGNLYAKVVDHNLHFNPINGFEISERSSLIEAVRERIFAEFEEEVLLQEKNASDIKSCLGVQQKTEKTKFSQYRVEISKAVRVAENLMKSEQFQGFMPKKKVIKYEMVTTRTSDGQMVATQKRYSELQTFFNTLIKKNLIGRSGAQFPEKKSMQAIAPDSGSLNEQSEFVQERKQELDEFFQEIFKQNPSLFQDEFVASFLTLDQMPGRGVVEFKTQESESVKEQLIPGSSFNNDKMVAATPANFYSIYNQPLNPPDSRTVEV